MEGLECYVIEMRFQGYGEQEHLFGPTFYKTFLGRDVFDGQIVTGDITQAHRFPTAGSAVNIVRGLLNNPLVCNNTKNSYAISIRKLVCGIAKSARLSDNGLVSLFE